MNSIGSVETYRSQLIKDLVSVSGKEIKQSTKVSSKGGRRSSVVQYNNKYKYQNKANSNTGSTKCTESRTCTCTEKVKKPLVLYCAVLLLVQVQVLVRVQYK